jgi:prepilin-type N-terminal cleavage/methylation domain-containing protein
MTHSGRSYRIRTGFTLVELVITLALIGLVSITMFPKIFRETGDDTLLLQRTVYEAMDIASAGGYPVRIIIGPEGKLDPQFFLVSEEGSGKWEKLSLKWLPGSAGWSSAVKEFYVYPDGTCSPWNLVLQRKNKVIRQYLVTVTGHVHEIEKGSP